MGSVSEEITKLMDLYKKISVRCVKEICESVGVPYQEPEDSHILQHSLMERGYKMEIQKYTGNPDSVGQYIQLLDLVGNLMVEYKVYIVYRTFQVKVDVNRPKGLVQ